MSTDRPFIIAFDVSKTCTGICEGFAGETPRFFSLRGEGIEVRKAVANLGTWVIDRTKLDEVDLIAIEASIHPGAWRGDWDEEKQKVVAKQDPMTGIVLSRLVSIVEFVADKKGIPTMNGHVQSMRAKFLGHGRPSDPKQRAKAMCRELGWEPKNLDQADAGVLWWFASMRRAPRFYQPITPMMQARVNSLFDQAHAAKTAGAKARGG